jgi:hypothetical protein
MFGEEYATELVYENFQFAINGEKAWDCNID